MAVLSMFPPLMFTLFDEKVLSLVTVSPSFAVNPPLTVKVLLVSKVVNLPADAVVWPMAVLSMFPPLMFTLFDEKVWLSATVNPPFAVKVLLVSKVVNLPADAVVWPMAVLSMFPPLMFTLFDEKVWLSATVNPPLTVKVLLVSKVVNLPADAVVWPMAVLSMFPPLMFTLFDEKVLSLVTVSPSFAVNPPLTVKVLLVSKVVNLPADAVVWPMAVLSMFPPLMFTLFDEKVLSLVTVSPSFAVNPPLTVKVLLVSKVVNLPADAVVSPMAVLSMFPPLMFTLFDEKVLSLVTVSPSFAVNPPLTVKAPLVLK